MDNEVQIMKVFTRRIAGALVALLLMGRFAAAGEFFEPDGQALRGYDAVSYFETGVPTPGFAKYTFTYRGSRFLFASADHQRKFAADPGKYAPQFGGFCAYGAANGYKVSTQPDAFKVVDGKLYLNYDRKVLGIWSKDEPGNIARADQNWPEVSKQPLKQ
jgi:YHS domain-containing protein